MSPTKSKTQTSIFLELYTFVFFSCPKITPVPLILYCIMLKVHNSGINAFWVTLFSHFSSLENTTKKFCRHCHVTSHTATTVWELFHWRRVINLPSIHFEYFPFAERALEGGICVPRNIQVSLSLRWCHKVQIRGLVDDSGCQEPGPLLFNFYWSFLARLVFKEKKSRYCHHSGVVVVVSAVFQRKKVEVLSSLWCRRRRCRRWRRRSRCRRRRRRRDKL